MRAWNAGAFPSDDGFVADLPQAEQHLRAFELEIGGVVKSVAVRSGGARR